MIKKKIPEYLNKIIEAKQSEVDFLKSKYGLNYFKEKVSQDSQFKSVFSSVLARPGLQLIAEVKKASPSKGIINSNFDPIKVAQQYAQNGASLLSVLTEKKYFLGHPRYINYIKSDINLPIIRKDFIFDELQVYESRCLNADAILLIAAILEDSRLQELIHLSAQLGLDVIVEIHNESELQRVLDLKEVKIIGINNRNLNTFSVDINIASILFKNYFKDNNNYLTVAESGYCSVSELKAIESVGFSGVLIGEGLVKHKDIIDYFKKK
ncbi:indole-3-glycerol phosphate synthase TrpC [Candidatus Marinamargulisbacteria bacterium SCGC AG-410-N11]|nr:indole-3-glycerol phosphate synthase TrpC [Candidatus Marinamargulisbacteria bacterium SCGC AG-410-N11]